MLYSYKNINFVENQDKNIQVIKQKTRIQIDKKILNIYHKK